MREPPMRAPNARLGERVPLCEHWIFWAQSRLVSRRVSGRFRDVRAWERGVKFLCDRCKTRYSIGDDRVRGKILKIRCKNCANVITVREGMDELRDAGRAAPPRRPRVAPIPMPTPAPNGAARRRVRGPAPEAAAGARGGVVRLDRRRPVGAVLARRGAALGRGQAVRCRPPLLERGLRRLAPRRQGQPLPRPAQEAGPGSGAAADAARDPARRVRSAPRVDRSTEASPSRCSRRRWRRSRRARRRRCRRSARRIKTRRRGTADALRAARPPARRRRFRSVQRRAPARRGSVPARRRQGHRSGRAGTVQGVSPGAKALAAAFDRRCRLDDRGRRAAVRRRARDGSRAGRRRQARARGQADPLRRWPRQRRAEAHRPRCARGRARRRQSRRRR